MLTPLNSPTEHRMNKPILKNSKLGSTLIGEGVEFSVWAPHADSVAVVGNFNGWDSTQHPMKAGDNGRWNLFTPDAKVGDEYLSLIHI